MHVYCTGPCNICMHGSLHKTLHVAYLLLLETVKHVQMFIWFHNLEG